MNTCSEGALIESMNQDFAASPSGS